MLNAADGGNAKRVSLLGCHFDPIGMDEAATACLDWCGGERQPHTVVTVNAAIITMLLQEPSLWEACTASDVVVVDGVPVVWSSRLLGTPLPERVAGIDLMQRLMKDGAERGLSVYFLGSTDAILEKLLKVVERDYLGLRVAGARNGYFAPEEYDNIVDQVRAAEPDMLFVGMPTPFKETWCFKYRSKMNVPVIMGVGGSFDVISGVVRRAPLFVQQMGMEWFWRFLMRPRAMFKRYLYTNTQYLWLLARELVRMRLLGRPPMQPKWRDEELAVGPLPNRKG